MDWTAFTLVIPIGRWVKEQLGIAGRERRVSAREEAVARRGKELNDLIELRDFNIKHISDLVFLQPEYVSYRLGKISNMADVQFCITNRSIFDVIMRKFIVRPKFEEQKLATMSEVEERKITGQSATSFTVAYELQLPTAERLKSQREAHETAVWHFEMHGYFHSEVGDFEKQQSSSLSTHP